MVRGRDRRRGGRAWRLETSRRNAVVVESPDGDRHVVRVKTRSSGTWQASKTDEDLRRDDTELDFWAFVDASVDPITAYIVESRQVADGIRKLTDEWVARDSSRARTGHHAIEFERVSGGADRWDYLGL